MTDSQSDLNNVEPIDPRKPIVVPGLATIYLETENPETPNLKIVLADDYDGDLRDVALETKGDDNVFLQCNHITALGNEQLAMFMETLALHDYTGDGKPDCAPIVDRIEEALYVTKETPRNFRRPAEGLYTKIVMSIMPPEPEHHIVMGYGRLQSRFKLHHHAVGVLMVAAFLALVWAQIQIAPFMKYSVISGFLAGVEWIGWHSWVGVLLFVVLINVMRRFGRDRDDNSSESSLSRHTVGFFSKASVFEEQAFREGSEDWNFQQRLRSCFAFGAIHMVNLIYPLASILPLALGGAVFMAMYLRKYRQTGSRRAAVLRASVWHRVYNRVALTVAVISLLLWSGSEIFGIFAAVLLVFAIGFVFDMRNLRRSNSTLSVVQTAKVLVRS